MAAAPFPPAESGPPRFIADSMVGRLARLLRALGFDVAYDPRIEDSTLLRRAKEEGRLLLTRDTHLLERRGLPPTLFIESDFVEDQLAQVVAACKLGPADSRPLTRCLVCNAVLEPVAKEMIRGKVPPFVYSTQREFVRCPGCERIYWAGTHVSRMLARLKRITG